MVLQVRRRRTLLGLDQKPYPLDAPPTGAADMSDAMNDVVERCAKAICADSGFAPGTVFAREAKAALSTLRPGDELPGGLVCVSKKATQAMSDAGWIDKEDVSPAEIWSAMLAAAKEEG